MLIIAEAQFWANGLIAPSERNHLLRVPVRFAALNKDLAEQLEIFRCAGPGRCQRGSAQMEKRAHIGPKEGVTDSKPGLSERAPLPGMRPPTGLRP